MHDKIRYQLISWAEVQRLCLKLACMIRTSGYQPEIVIAIARGGYVPARLLCDYLDIMNLTSIKIEHYLSLATKEEQATIRYPLCTDIKNRRVLLVDDVNDSGDTLDVAIKHLLPFKPSEIRIAVMHHKIVSHFSVDYYACKIVKWRWLTYPWAVTEDITNLLKQINPQPDNVEEAHQQLKQQFGIYISRKRLEQVYVLLEETEGENKQPHRKRTGY